MITSLENLAMHRERGTSPAKALAFAASIVCLVLLVAGARSADAATSLGLASTFGSSQLSSPNAIAIDQSSGNVFVTDIGNNSIRAFTASGTPLPELTIDEGNMPAGKSFTLGDVAAIAVDNSGGASDGDIYVRNNSTSEVIDKFSPTGTFLAQWDGANTPQGSFGGPDGIAVDASGDVYVANYWSSVVDKFTSSGEYLSQLTSVSSAVGIALDAGGDLFATEYTSAPSIVEFSPTGTQLRVLDKSTGDIGVAVDASRAYVDAGTRLVEYGTEGSLIAEAAPASLKSRAIAVNETTHQVYATDTGDDAVDVFEPVTVPDVTTGAATAVGTSSATLSGTINPEGNETRYRFELGTDTIYGREAPFPGSAAGSGSIVKEVSQTIANLQPETTYHYRLVAIVDGTPTKGGDHTFTTGDLTTAELSQPPSLDGLDEFGAKATWFLGMRNSRLVMNPSATSFTCGPVDPGGSNAPLSLGYYYGHTPGVYCLPSAIEVNERGTDGKIHGASSVERTWTPYELRTNLEYADGANLVARDSFYGANTVLRSLAGVHPPPSEGTLEIGGKIQGTPTYDATTHELVVEGSNYNYAILLPASGSVSFYANEADYRSGASSESPANAGYWAVTAGEGTEGANDDVLLTVGPAKESASELVEGLPEGASEAASAAESVLKREEEASTVLSEVPRPSNFTITDTEPQGVTPSQVRTQYYKSWAYLAEELLPNTPENEYDYPQFPISKASTLTYDIPGATYSDGYESVTSIQDYAYIDPSVAWEAYEGLLNMEEPSGEIPVGEVTPSRIAQTALVLYEVSGDKPALASVYSKLATNIEWVEHNLRYISVFGYPSPVGEIDANYVSYALTELHDMALITQILEMEPSTTTFWEEQIPAVWKEVQGALWPEGPSHEANEYYFPEDSTCGPRNGCTGFTALKAEMLVSPVVAGEYASNLLSRYLLSYGPESGTDSRSIYAHDDSKGTDLDLMFLGLMERGYRNYADYGLNNWVRNMVSSNVFSEMYQPNGSGGTTNDGVFPSFLGGNGLIDFVWMKNGYISEYGAPAFYDLDQADGAVSHVKMRGQELNESLDASTGTVSLSGSAVAERSECTSIELSGQIEQLPDSCLEGSGSPSASSRRP